MFDPMRKCTLAAIIALTATARTANVDSGCNCPFLARDYGDYPAKRPCCLAEAGGWWSDADCTIDFTAYQYPINADVNWDAVVDVQDFLMVLTAWGRDVRADPNCYFNYAWEEPGAPLRSCYGMACWPEPGCCIPEDVDGDGWVGVLDFLEVLASWGRESGADCGCGL